MPERIQQPPDQPTPVTEDSNASAPQLLARADADYAAAQAAARAKRQQGGPGVRGGILPAGSAR